MPLERRNNHLLLPWLLHLVLVTPLHLSGSTHFGSSIQNEKDCSDVSVFVSCNFTRGRCSIASAVFLFVVCVCVYVCSSKVCGVFKKTKFGEETARARERLLHALGSDSARKHLGGLEKRRKEVLLNRATWLACKAPP